MTMVLQYASECAECKKVMRPGEEVEFLTDGGGKYRHVHTKCPPDERRTVRQQSLGFKDNEHLFSFLDCEGGCAPWAFRVGTATPSVCPGCGAAWTEDNPWS